MSLQARRHGCESQHPDDFVRKNAAILEEYMMQIKYTHTNINAKDWRKLSKFYQDVFDCVPLGKLRDNKGEWFERLTGIKGAHAVGEHIGLPGYPDGNGPTFEIFSYEFPEDVGPLPFNGYGFCHVCFEVDDVDEVYDRFIKAGGSICGEKIVNYYPDRKGTNIIIYGRDIEGNGVEIKRWIPDEK